MICVTDPSKDGAQEASIPESSERVMGSAATDRDMAKSKRHPDKTRLNLENSGMTKA